jgi:hypothetical protein
MSEPDELPDQPDLCWPLDPACLADSWEDYEPEVRARATALATASLYRLTLGRVGGCPITVRPCPQRASQGRPYLGYPALGGGAWQPVNYAGSWVNCGCGYPCGCETGCEIKLGTYIGRVDEIKVDGVAVTETDYTIVNNELIVWQGTGTCPFPKTQDMSKPAGQAGTFTVTYLPAHEVDGLGAWAAGTLAAEFAKACTGNKTCKLPAGTTAVVRQGISITLISGAFPDGKTGLREVDAYIAMWNPRGLAVAPRVWSPDLVQVRQES